MLNRADVIDVLQAHASALSAMEVIRLALFGSVARGENTQNSDVDLMIDVTDSIPIGLFGLGRIQVCLQEWLGYPVDLAIRQRLRPDIAEEAERDAVCAF